MWRLYTISFYLIRFVLVPCNAQVSGCTDPLAVNYDPSADINDGSCTYDPVSVAPTATFELGDDLNETSGLVIWDGLIWTLNDNDDTRLYGLDSSTAEIVREVNVGGVTNRDWEEIGQDELFIYLGDFGNNASGDRKDLHLLRVEKRTFYSGEPGIDTIWFSYSNQERVDSAGAGQTDFDCEAFIVSDDSIYLFTKQWTSARTTAYVLPKVPGTWVARQKETFDIEGLVTGATWLESKHLLVLSGYTWLLQPFLYLFYDFRDHAFFSGNRRRVTLPLPFHQVEGVATCNGLKYYISNELFDYPPVASTPPGLHIIEMDSLLEDYLAILGIQDQGSPGGAILYPNPAAETITLKVAERYLHTPYTVVDVSARPVIQGVLSGELNTIDVSSLSPGFYSVSCAFADKPHLIFMKL